MCPYTPQLECFLTVKQAATILNIAPRSVWRLIADGRVRVKRFGRSVRISKNALDEFIEDN